MAVTLPLGIVLGVLSAIVGAPRAAQASTVTLTYTFAQHPSGATWTVPNGVTSFTFDIRGGAGGSGGQDSFRGPPGSGGVYGRFTGTVSSLLAGTVVGIFPGESGGTGSSNVSGRGGGAGGRSSFSSSFNGARGGNAGPSGTSGGGGGGGAASILTVGGTTSSNIRALAAGAGGGGGGNNVQASGSGQGGTQTNQVGGSTTTGGTTAGAGAAGNSCGTGDGGGGGGGGGGNWAGQGGTTFRNGSECVPFGGWRGDNQWPGVALSSLPTGVTSTYTKAVAASTIIITFTVGDPTTPDLTVSTDRGFSSSDNVTTWTSTNKPVFTGTAVGGSTVTLGINGSYTVNCGVASVTTGEYSCTWTPSADGTYNISVRATYENAVKFSGSLSVRIDTARPTATLTTAASTSATRTVSFTANFNEAIYDLASGDFANGGTATGCTFTPSIAADASATSATIAVACSSDGTVILQLASGSVIDTAGNTGPPAAVTSSTVTINTTPAAVTLTPATITSAGSATARSSEAGTAYLVNTTVTVTDFSSITEAAGNLVNDVPIAANTSTSIPATGLIDGSYRLYVWDNTLLSSPSTGVVVVDSTVPTAAWTTVPSSPARSWSLSYVLTFGEDISGLDAGDLTLTGTAAGSCAASVSAATGSVITVSVTCTADGTLTVSLNANGVTDAAGNTGPVSAVTATEITIDAQFVVTYDSQSGSSIASGLTMFGGAISTSPGTPLRDGYTFSGWSASPAGATVTFPYTHNANDNFTLYAIWSANTLSVTFNSGGGTAVSSATVKTNETLAAPTPPTRTGYTFANWWTASTDGSQVQFPYTHGRTSDFTLFARWNGNTLVATFNTGEGGSSVANGSTVSGGTLAEPASPTRSGFSFVGWSTTESGGSPVRFVGGAYTHGRTANFTLYAIWRSESEPRNVWFYPAVGRATIGNLTFAPKTAGDNVMAPEFPRSTTTYSISTTITQPGGVEELDTVTMCWFKSTIDGEEGVPEPGVSESCDNAVTDPETEIKAVWSRATNSFELTGASNNQLLVGAALSRTNYTPGNSTLEIHFHYKISHATRSGSWTVAVISTDSAGASQIQTLNATVEFWSTSSTSRASQSFGVVAPGASVTLNDFPAGVFTANSNAKFTISATPFTFTENETTKTLDFAAGDTAPSAGQVALDCSLGSTLSNPVRVPNANATVASARIREFDEALTPTREPQRVQRNMSCRLTYGGGASRSLVQYSSSVTFGLAARSAAAGGGGGAIPPVGGGD